MTAEEYFLKETGWSDMESIEESEKPEDILELMIGFAQHHVKEALRMAYANAKVEMRDELYEGRIFKINNISESSIINSYPLSKIK